MTFRCRSVSRSLFLWSGRVGFGTANVSSSSIQCLLAQIHHHFQLVTLLYSSASFYYSEDGGRPQVCSSKTGG